MIFGCLQVKFATRVWHPNVSAESGELCSDFLTTTWSSSKTLMDVLIAVRSLLSEPNAGSLIVNSLGNA